MQQEKNIQLKCHSQVSVSAIPTLALFRSSSRRVSMRDIAKQLYPGLRHSGMTSHFNSPLIRTSSTFPLDGEGVPFAWRERAECVSTGVRGKSAFTLIELLVVVLIIGVLAAVVLPQYRVAVVKSRLATVKLLIATLKTAEEDHYLANGEYTDDLTKLSINTSCTSFHYDAFHCDNYFVIDPLNSGQSNMVAHYCPNATSWDSCIDSQDFYYTVWFDHSNTPGQITCTGVTSLGNKICSGM